MFLTMLNEFLFRSERIPATAARVPVVLLGLDFVAEVVIVEVIRYFVKYIVQFSPQERLTWSAIIIGWYFLQPVVMREAYPCETPFTHLTLIRHINSKRVQFAMSNQFLVGFESQETPTAEATITLQNVRILVQLANHGKVLQVWGISGSFLCVSGKF